MSTERDEIIPRKNSPPESPPAGKEPAGNPPLGNFRRTRVLGSVSYFRLQVFLENSTRMGKISSRPASMARDSTSLDRGE